ncbi:MAG TPA: hypothetical protein VHW06_08785 [Streptosporangiaceae bacterium]|jgi:hypothetical protein|nr:hypothetical protein [Streptosporangiaceae bacterium]
MLIATTFLAAILPAAAGLGCWMNDRPGRWGAAVVAGMWLYVCATFGSRPGLVLCAGWLVIAGGRWVHDRRRRGPSRSGVAARWIRERELRMFRTELDALGDAAADERRHAACHDPLPGDRRVA